MRFQNKRLAGQPPPGRGTKTAPRAFNLPLDQRRPFSNSADEASYEDKPPEEGFRTDASMPPPEPTDTRRGGVDEPNSINGFRPTPRYTITNLVTDRSYNAAATSVTELADVLGTFINDVNSRLEFIERRLRDA